MRTLPVLLVSALALVFAAQAEAASPGKKKLYRWTDANGEVHYTDALPPQAASDARDTLNSAGRAVDHTERAPTEEERAVRDAETARLEQEKRLADDKAKMDAVLVASYPSEVELERAYKERFDLIEQSVESARVGIRSQEKSLTDLLSHAGDLERNGRNVPPTVIESIGKTRAQVADQLDYLAKREAERAALRKEYEDLLARYRHLTSARAETSGATPQ
jgi:hypothetical protein